MARSLIQAIALEIQAPKYSWSCLRSGWPEGAVKAVQTSKYSVDFVDEDDNPIEDYEEVELVGLPSYDEWDGGEEVTIAQLRAFMLANPDLAGEFAAKERANISRIAELNTQIAALIDEMTALAEEANLDVCIDLGQHGSLDPDSDWDASRC